MRKKQIALHALEAKFHHEVVTALAKEFVPFFAEFPHILSVTWCQDPYHYNDEETFFQAYTQPESLILNGQEHKPHYEPYQDPLLQAAAQRASTLIRSFPDRLLAWLHEDCVKVTITTKGVKFKTWGECY